MNTVADTPETKALPQVQESPLRAAANPSKNTSPDPEAMALAPCPGIGQLVGSVIRAAGFAMHDSLSVVFGNDDFIRDARLKALLLRTAAFVHMPLMIPPRFTDVRTRTSGRSTGLLPAGNHGNDVRFRPQADGSQKV